ncbi:hypothetical protein D3C73_1264750 [compost metagenome]
MVFVLVEVFIANKPGRLLREKVRMRQSAQADTPSPPGFIVGVLDVQQTQHGRGVVLAHAVLQGVPTFRTQRARVRKIRGRAIGMQPRQLIKIGAYPQADGIVANGPDSPRIDTFCQIGHCRIPLHAMRCIAACRMSPQECGD